MPSYSLGPRYLKHPAPLLDPGIPRPRDSRYSDRLLDPGLPGTFSNKHLFIPSCLHVHRFALEPGQGTTSQTGVQTNPRLHPGVGSPRNLLIQAPSLLSLTKAVPALSLEGSLGREDTGTSCPFLPKVYHLAHRLYTQRLLHGFIHHVAEAACWQHLQ